MRGWATAAKKADAEAEERGLSSPLARLEQSRRTGASVKKLRRESMTMSTLAGHGGSTPWEDREATVRGQHGKALHLAGHGRGVPLAPPRGTRDNTAAAGAAAADMIKAKVKAKAKAKKAKKAKKPLTAAEKKAKQLVKRGHVGRELVTGEQHYVEGLHECLNHYVAALESTPHPLARQFLDRFEVSSLFTSMKVLTIAAEVVVAAFVAVTKVAPPKRPVAPPRGTNAKAKAAEMPKPEARGWMGTLFGGHSSNQSSHARTMVVIPTAPSTALEGGAATAPAAGDDDHASTWCFGDAVVKVAPLFASVAPYAAWVDSAMDVLDGFRKKAGFSELLQAMQAGGPDGMHNLESLIIAPVQRVARYGLLMKELLKQTPEDHPDYAPLSRALDAVNTQAGAINTTVGGWSNRLKLISIQDALNGRGIGPWGENYARINESGRVFVREGLLTKKHITSLGMKDYQCHLFNDKLLLSTPLRGAEEALAAGSSSRLAAPTMRLYKLHDTVELRGGATVRALPSAEFGGGSYVTESSFELRCAEKVLILSAQDDRARDAWVRSLNEVCENNRLEEEVAQLAEIKALDVVHARVKINGAGGAQRADADRCEALERIMRCFGTTWDSAHFVVESRRLLRAGSVVMKTPKGPFPVEIFLSSDCLIYGRVTGMRSHMRPARRGEDATPPRLEYEPRLAAPVNMPLETLKLNLEVPTDACAFALENKPSGDKQLGLQQSAVNEFYASSAAERDAWVRAIEEQKALWMPNCEVKRQTIFWEERRASEAAGEASAAGHGRSETAQGAPAARQRRAAPTAPPRRSMHAMARAAGGEHARRVPPSAPKRGTRPQAKKRGSVLAPKLRSDGDWCEHIDPTNGQRSVYNKATAKVFNGSWEMMLEWKAAGGN